MRSKPRETPLIELCFQSGAYVILLRLSGVVYTNQAGGTECLHPEAEGVLAPLDNEAPYEFSISARLQKLFPEGSRLDITRELADSIDAILRESDSTNIVRVDRDRLRESHEAWVFVIVDSPRTYEATYTGPSILGFGPAPAIITWPNSD